MVFCKSIARAARAVQVAATLALAMLCAACSSTRPWINEPLQPGLPGVDVTEIAQRDPSALVAVTLSGGGARAAAFGLGVLRELHATGCCWDDRSSNLLDAVDLVSGVSGGSIIAAYFAAFGAAGLDGFETKFLRQDFQGGLVNQLLRPQNLLALTSPWIGRGHLLEEQLDQLFNGETFGDIARRPRHPQLVVTATDLARGTGFDFTAEQFDLICSDLSTVPLSFAVAASSAVPLLLTPMTLRNYAAQCSTVAREAPATSPYASDYRSRLLSSQRRSYRNEAAAPYIHLVDGGLADNLGVRRLLDRAMSAGTMAATFNEVRIRPGSIKRLVLVSVNAGGERSHRIEDSDRVPATLEVIDALRFSEVAHANDETTEYLTDIAQRWRDDVRSGRQDAFVGFAPDVEIFLIKLTLRSVPDAQLSHRLLQVPTAFSIADADVTDLIAAGGIALRESPEFQALKRSLGRAATP